MYLRAETRHEVVGNAAMREKPQSGCARLGNDGVTEEEEDAEKKSGRSAR